MLWIVGSALFSFYVSSFGSYDTTYGSLAAPVLLLWFWLSALIVLIGAEIDAELGANRTAARFGLLLRKSVKASMRKTSWST